MSNGPFDLTAIKDELRRARYAEEPYDSADRWAMLGGRVPELLDEIYRLTGVVAELRSQLHTMYGTLVEGLAQRDQARQELTRLEISHEQVDARITPWQPGDPIYPNEYLPYICRQCGTSWARGSSDIPITCPECDTVQSHF